MLTLHGDENAYKHHWVRWLEEAKSGSLPQRPGTGFISMTAVKLNACSAIVTLISGEQVVCGQPLEGKYKSPDPYLCMGHHLENEDYKDKIRGKAEKKEEPVVKPVIEYETESDLPF